MSVSRHWRVCLAGLTLIAAGSTALAQDPTMAGPPPAPPAPPAGGALATGNGFFPSGAQVQGGCPHLAAPPVPYPGTIPGGYCKYKVPHHFEKKANSACWRKLQACWWGYPEEYVPQPLGRLLYGAMQPMVSNGTAARMVLYDYDFEQGTARLNQHGKDRVAMISGLLANTPYPAVVERTPDVPALAEQRRYAVLAELAGSPYPVTSDRVLIGPPLAFGVTGTQGVIINAVLDERTRAGGPFILLNPGFLPPASLTTPVYLGGGVGLAR